MAASALTGKRFGGFWWAVNQALCEGQRASRMLGQEMAGADAVFKECGSPAHILNLAHGKSRHGRPPRPTNPKERRNLSAVSMGRQFVSENHLALAAHATGARISPHLDCGLAPRSGV